MISYYLGALIVRKRCRQLHSPGQLGTPTHAGTRRLRQNQLPSFSVAKDEHRRRAFEKQGSNLMLFSNKFPKEDLCGWSYKWEKTCDTTLLGFVLRNRKQRLSGQIQQQNTFVIVQLSWNNILLWYTGACFPIASGTLRQGLLYSGYTTCKHLSRNSIILLVSFHRERLKQSLFHCHILHWMDGCCCLKWVKWKTLSSAAAMPKGLISEGV